MFPAPMMVTFMLVLLVALTLDTRLSYPGRSRLTPPPMHHAARRLP
jgi:hypothetical protein